MRGGAGGPVERSNTLPVMARRIELLRHQHRQVLCGRVPEDRNQTLQCQSCDRSPYRTTVLGVTSYAMPRRGAKLVKLFFTLP